MFSRSPNKARVVYLSFGLYTEILEIQTLTVQTLVRLQMFRPE